MQKLFKKWHYGYFLLLGLLLVLALPISPFWQSFGCDKEVFRYFGDILANGGKPYIDYFDHKPPIIHLIYSLPFIQDNYWGDWFFFNGLIFFNAILIVITSQKKGKTAWFLAILWIVYMRFLPIVLDGGNSREVTANLIMTFLCLHFYSPKKHFILKGALTGMVLFTQPNDIIALFPFYCSIFFISLKERADRIRFLLKSSLGFLIPTLSLLLYLWTKDALLAFWENAVLFNFKTYLFSGDLFYKIRITLSYSFKFFLPLAVLVFMSRTNSILFQKDIFIVSIAIFLQLLSNIMGAVFTHYFLTIIPYCIGFFLYYFNENSYQKNKFWMLAVLVYLIIFSNLPKHIAKSGNMAFIKKDKFIDSTLKTIQNRNDQLFGFNTIAYIHYANKYNIKSPGIYIYHHFWQQKKFDSGLVILKQLVAAIEANKTRYILDCNSEIYFYRPEVKQYYYNYILANYTPVYRTLYSDKDSLTLFQRKN